MASSKKDEIISEASPHTIKKFELIEAYTKAWARKLLGYKDCQGIVFIDCMCNSGLYYREGTEELVEGSPIRVARVLSSIMREPDYQGKQAWLYFNDLSQEKIDELKKHLPVQRENFHIVTSAMDGNLLITKIGDQLGKRVHYHYLLVYDPYQATIDWGALLPFIRNWGEIILNHMVSDTIRAVSQAKRQETVLKYEMTYLSNLEQLIELGSDRDKFENRIKKIIYTLNGSKGKDYYIASYPFFNTKNTVVYNLIHCTSNIIGFKLFKSIAWKTFGDKSSMKRPSIMRGQMQISFQDNGEVEYATVTDENCYYVSDIADFIAERFEGRKAVSLDEIWAAVDAHPVFPSELYKKEIKKDLKERGYCVHKSTIDF